MDLNKDKGGGEPNVLSYIQNIKRKTEVNVLQDIQRKYHHVDEDEEDSMSAGGEDSGSIGEDGVKRKKDKLSKQKKNFKKMVENSSSEDDSDGGGKKQSKKKMNLFKKTASNIMENVRGKKASFLNKYEESEEEEQPIGYDFPDNDPIYQFAQIQKGNPGK